MISSIITMSPTCLMPAGASCCSCPAPRPSHIRSASEHLHINRALLSAGFSPSADALSAGHYARIAGRISARGRQPLAACARGRHSPAPLRDFRTARFACPMSTSSPTTASVRRRARMTIPACLRTAATRCRLGAPISRRPPISPTKWRWGDEERRAYVTMHNAMARTARC